MRFLRIKNFEQYQHYGQRNPPWIKLYKSLLTDHAFLQLSITARYLYVGLLILASETDNKVVNDPSYIAQRLFISPSDVDLKPLFRSGFLLASEASIRRVEKSRDREEKSREDKCDAIPLASTQASRRLTDEEWLTQFVRSNPAYLGINIDDELAKMDTWLSTRPQKKKTRRFITNWLNRVEKPVAIRGVERPRSLVDLL